MPAAGPAAPGEEGTVKISQRVAAFLEYWDRRVATGKSQPLHDMEEDILATFVRWCEAEDARMRKEGAVK